MTTKELAQKLNGSKCENEISSELYDQAKNNNFVIVFNTHENVTEFLGSINDSFFCYDYTTIFLDKNGLTENDCDNTNCPYYIKTQQQSKSIVVINSPKKNGFIYADWIYKTDIPHETFDIFENDELYCKGIVFSINDI